MESIDTSKVADVFDKWRYTPFRKELSLKSCHSNRTYVRVATYDSYEYAYDDAMLLGGERNPASRKQSFLRS